MEQFSKMRSFSAGPGKHPPQVLKLAQQELLAYGTTGISVMEMSHRTPEFTQIILQAEKDLRDILNIPTNYKVLFLQGGGNGQFASVPLNLLLPGGTADYVVNGYWTTKAMKEAAKYGQVNNTLNIRNVNDWDTIPPQAEWKLNKNASYVYICDNETIQGIEYNFVPETYGVPIVADMSTNFCSKQIDVSKYGVIFACCQKNVGPAGMAIVIVREDLLGYSLPICPSFLDFKIQSDAGSMYNTPPTFSVYMAGLAFKWMKEQGGLKEIEKTNNAKAALVYNAIDASNGFYVNEVEKQYRSKMNAVFRIHDFKRGNPELENVFLKEAKQWNLIGLNGHRSVGGLQASLYNAVTYEDVTVLVEFMNDFQQRYQ